MFIGVYEPINHAFGKLVLQIENIEWETQAARDAARVLRVVERAAGVAPGQARVLIIVELHHAADTVITLVGEKLGRNAGIHAA